MSPAGRSPDGSAVRAVLYTGIPTYVGLWRSLGARFHGMEEVVGSIPTRSTSSFICLEYLAHLNKGCDQAWPVSSKSVTT